MFPDSGWALIKNSSYFGVELEISFLLQNSTLEHDYRRVEL